MTHPLSPKAHLPSPSLSSSIFPGHPPLQILSWEQSITLPIIRASDSQICQPHPVLSKELEAHIPWGLLDISPWKSNPQGQEISLIQLHSSRSLHLADWHCCTTLEALNPEIRGYPSLPPLITHLPYSLVVRTFC